MDNSTTLIRPMQCDIGTFSRSDGSAVFTLGNTVAIAGVYGPCEVNARKLLIDQAAIDICYKPKSGISGMTDKLSQETHAAIAEQAILTSMHPRTSISITIQELNDCGGMLACSINAMCLALIHSGLPMKFLFAAVNAIIDSEENILVDPEENQRINCQSEFTIVFEQIGNNILATEACGVYTKEQLSKVINLCRKASKEIFSFYKVVVNKYSENIGYNC